MKTVIIEHKQWGKVEGVELAVNEIVQWVLRKDGRITYFNFCDGWREVKTKKWVDVPVTFNGVSKFRGALLEYNGFELFLPPGYRWKTVAIEREVEG